MQANSTLGRMMYMDIAHDQLKPIHDGCALKHKGDKYIYCRTTQDRIVRKKGVVKEVYDPARQRFVRSDNLRAGEKVDLSRPFTIEDLAPGVYQHLRDQPMAALYAHLLPKPAPAPAPPAPARESFVPKPTPADYAPSQGMAEIDAMRDTMRADKDRLWGMENAGPFAPF
jgi:hypothetical protein